MRLIAVFALLAISIATAGAVAAQVPGQAEALNAQVGQLHSQGRFGEAMELAKRALAVAEKAGPDAPVLAVALNNLGVLLVAQGRLAEAEAPYLRALAITERVLGPNDSAVGNYLNNLGDLYTDLGRHSDAERYLQRALALTEGGLGPDHPNVSIRLHNLAALYKEQARFAEAESLQKRALAIAQKAFGPNHPVVSTRLGGLATLYKAQGRYADAERNFKQALSITEKAVGPDHLDVGMDLSNLALLYLDQGRYAEAEPLLRRSFAITEKALGPNHRTVGTAMNNLATLYKAQGRLVEAEQLYKRALAITTTEMGPDHPQVGIRLDNLAQVYHLQNRYAEAEPLYKRALAISQKLLRPNHPEIGARLNNLANLYHLQRRYSDAEQIFKQALAITEAGLGPSHPDVGVRLNNLASVYANQGRYAEAEPLYQRALVISEKVLGADHPDVADRLHNLAWLHFARQNWPQAASYWRRSTAISQRRFGRDAADIGQAMTGAKRSEAEQRDMEFRALVKVAHRLMLPGQRDRELTREMFVTAQWAALGSEAAGSLAKMAARGAKGDAKLSTIVRERQDLVEEWQKRDAQRVASMSQGDKRDQRAEAANVVRLTAIDKRIADIDKRFTADYPGYAALARPTPLSVQDVQAQITADEAVVLFLDTPGYPPTGEETFIWVVTKTDARWVRAELGTEKLAREVMSLRCGLDEALWTDEAGASKCRTLLKLEPQRGAQGSLPFDAARAHALYKVLFGEVEDLIGSKHLLIVPSGPLTQLPFQVLVTARPSGNDFRSIAWLSRRNAISVLPAVSSLKALRRVARASTGSKPILGVGNPLLDGNPAEARLAELARQKQACQTVLSQQFAAGLSEKRGAARKVAMRSGRADLSQLKSQSPLHETADELCAVAKDLQASPGDTLLGASASEAAIKALSADGRLSQYRVLHFATHGTVAGDIKGTSEPGLILTPPARQTDQDDGYLSASEVAALKLDADWVILSACNTAAGGSPGAEALSGLASAFIYAGARALLVSHWAVNSQATVSLITNAIGALSRDQRLGRAEALRRAMLAMIDDGKPHEVHPAYWAPFVVVGEGASQ